MDFARISTRLVFAAALCAAFFGSARPAISDEILGGKLEKKSDKTEAEIKSAITRLAKQHTAEPKNYRVLFDLGNAYLDGNDQDKAKDAFLEAIGLNPKYVEAMVNLGGLYSDLEQQDEAIKWFTEALKVDPDNCKARSNLGNAYYAQQHYPDAMFEYRRAVEKDPNCYSAMYNIAVAFADAGLFRDAVNWWKKVERVAPGSDAARGARENINILDRFTQPPASGQAQSPTPAPAPAKSPDKAPQKHK